MILAIQNGCLDIQPSPSLCAQICNVAIHQFDHIGFLGARPSRAFISTDVEANLGDQIGMSAFVLIERVERVPLVEP